ncbi:MAG: glycosyltransferase [Armatimonadetes bacterium]|nr:glycosyltransferase [Armatimonadota bacterium]
MLERAAPNVELVGKVPDEEIANYYARCRAFIMPQEEDFGIAPLEAQACGRPVIAYRAGGALETVIEGETGLFFDAQEPEALVRAVEQFLDMSFDPQACRAQAERFSIDQFKRRLGEYVERRWQEHHTIP